MPVWNGERLEAAELEIIDDFYSAVQQRDQAMAEEIWRKALVHGGHALQKECLSKSRSCDPFLYAVTSNNQSLGNWLWEKAGEVSGKDLQQKFITAQSHTVFIDICTNRELGMGDWLWPKIAEAGGNNLQQECIEVRGHMAYRNACSSGQLDVSQWIWKKAEEIGGTDLQRGCLSSMNYEGFRYAAFNNHKNTVRWIWEMADRLGEIPAMLEALREVAPIEQTDKFGLISDCIQSWLVEASEKIGFLAAKERWQSIPEKCRHDLQPRYHQLLLAMRRKELSADPARGRM